MKVKEFRKLLSKLKSNDDIFVASDEEINDILHIYDIVYFSKVGDDKQFIIRPSGSIEVNLSEHSNEE